jgi:hypothetical protein
MQTASACRSALWMLRACSPRYPDRLTYAADTVHYTACTPIRVLMHKQAVIVIPTGEGVYQSYANHDQQLIQAPCLKSGLPEAEPAPDQSPVNLYQIPTKTDICVVITDLCSKRNRCACASITIRLLASASAPAHRTSDARSFFGLTNPGYAWHFTGTMVRVRVLSWPTR